MPGMFDPGRDLDRCLRPTIMQEAKKAQEGCYVARCYINFSPNTARGG